MKKLIIGVIGCFALAQMILGQTARPKIMDAEEQELLKIIKDEHLMHGSLAHRAMAIQRMLEEANFFSKQFGLPTPHPIQISDLREINVTPPWGTKIENTNLASKVERLRRAKFAVGGSIWTTNCCFFFRVGRLWSVVNRVQHMEQFDLYPVWAKTPSLVNSNGAVQMATQWLASIEVDIGALEKKYRPNVEQAFFWNRPGLDVYHPPEDTNKTMLPIFNVSWGGDAAQVRILGTTKELMELRVGDSTLSRRPLLIITNTLELLNIPDPPIKHLERPLPSQATNIPPATLPSGGQEMKQE